MTFGERWGYSWTGLQSIAGLHIKPDNAVELRPALNNIIIIYYLFSAGAVDTACEHSSDIQCDHISS